jgi:hypothetical protein
MENKFKEKNEYEKLLLENKSNSFLYLETLFEYVKYLTTLKDYNLIVSVLEEPLKKDFIQDKDERLKIINKLLQILLKIEDFVKLKNVLDHRNGLITSESDMIMQKFYYAVCYEGLEKYDLAIDTLLSIKDNISNQNLVNKYLKLSMLNLKIDQYLEAKKYFNQAVIFDKSRKNNAFLLAECDLLIYEKNYLKALSLYEDYYIKTNNKYRYLDRYLIIQMALNQLSEGYSFYLKHFPIMNKVLSKQSRLTFYQVALKLMKKLNKNDEIAKLVSLIFAINEEFIPFTNISDYSLRLIENNYNKTFAKKRDIIHAIFKEVSQTKMFSKLVYVNLRDDLIELNHYTKGLLLEKEITDISEKSVYAQIKDFSYKNLYEAKDFSSVSEDLFLNDKTKNIFVNKINDFDFLVFYFNSYDFYNAKKVFDFTLVLLKKLLEEFEIHGFNNKVLRNLIKLFDLESFGIFLLKNNQLSLLNQEAKNLLEIESDFISIEDFQQRLIKNIYVDELVKLDKVTLKYQAKDIKNIEFKIFNDEFDVFMLGKVLEDKSVSRRYYDFRYIFDEELDKDSALLLFNFRNYHDFLKDYSYNRYYKFLEKIYEVVKLSARNYYQNLYLEGMDNLYLILKTKDKRIIKRIYEDVFENIENETNAFAALVYLKDKITKADIEDLKYLISLTNEEARFLQDNKNYRMNREVSKTILINLEKIIEEKNIRISYQPVYNWKLNEVRYFYSDILNKSLLGNKKSLRRVIKANALEKEFDELFINNLFKDVRLANFKGNFFVEMSFKTLIDSKCMDNIKKRLNNKSFAGSKVIYLIDYEEFLDYNNYKLSDMVLAFRNVFKSFKLSDIKNLSLVKYVFVDKDELQFDGSKYLLKVLQDHNIEIIYDHKNSELTKTYLEEKSLVLVMGEAYGKYDSLKEIKKREKK